MPIIQVRDPTLVERLRRIKPVPDDYYDDVIYELLRRAESKGEFKPALKALDDLPRLVAEEVKKSLDGKLAEALQRALLPNIANLTIEVPVELSIRVRMRLEPILEPVFDVSTRSHSKTETLAENFSLINNNENNDTSRETSTDELERRAIEYLRERGGCWEGSAYSLARHIASDARQAVWALESRLRRRLRRVDGKICLPEAAAEAAVAQQ